MIANVKARYANGVLTPLEPLDIEEGAEVTVSVEGAPAGASGETPWSKRGLAGIVERVLEIQKDIPPEAWDDLPTDLAKNKKHYPHGHPKEEDCVPPGCRRHWPTTGTSNKLTSSLC